MLDICVCGWYLQEFDDFYASLHRLNKKYPVFVVSNKESEYLKIMDLPYTTRENAGLEWGAYNHFLMDEWKGENGVLFCHDDIEINPTVVNGEIQEPEYLFDRIAKVGVDQAYIFGSRHEDVENRGQHGRMLYISKDLLTKIKNTGGFWYDKKNKGYTTGEDSELRDRFDCQGYNAGIIAFNDQLKRMGGDIYRKIYIPSFSLAKRGERGSSTVNYGKWMDKVGTIIDSADKKLHVGCGDNYWETHTNVDLYNENADIKAHAKSLPLDDGSYDLVESHHLIEHMPKEEAKESLVEWHRVLRKGGHILLSCPDVTANFGLLQEAEQTPELWEGLMDTIYGTSAPGMAHKYGYSKKSLYRALKGAGFIDIEVKTAIGYRPTPSLIALAVV